MSNFVYPTWFEPFKHPRGTKFDHLGLLKAPFTMTKGGYVIEKRGGIVTEAIRIASQESAIQKGNDRLGHRSEYRKPKGKGPDHHVVAKRRAAVSTASRRRHSHRPCPPSYRGRRPNT